MLLLVLLFLAFTLIPLTEIYLLIQVGQVIGRWDTIGLVILSGIIGAYAAKTQGREVLGQMESQLRSGGEPSALFLQAVLVFIGGILMIAPGFLTDIVGMSFILPWTRGAYIKVLAQLFRKGVNIGKIHVYTGFGSDSTSGGFPRSTSKSTREPSYQKTPTLQKDADVIDISSYRNKE